MMFKKLLILLPLLALGLVGCGSETSDPELVEPTDPTPTEPADPTDPDPDPDPEEPVVTVDGQEEALKNLKALESVAIDGTYISGYEYDEGRGTDWYSYYDMTGIYTSDYVWAYYYYHGQDPDGTGYDYQTLTVNNDGICATESLNRHNVVEFTNKTDYYGETLVFDENYYQPFTYVTKDNTTWDDETLTLSIELASVDDNLSVFKELFISGRYTTATVVEVVFNSDYQPVSVSSETTTYYASSGYSYVQRYAGEFVSLTEAEANVSRAVAYDTYEEAANLQAILDTLKNATSYMVYSAAAPTYMYGLFDKDVGVLQVNPITGTSGTLQADENSYVTFNSVTGLTTVNANSGKLAGNAYDAYFLDGPSGIVSDYDVAAELFEYEGTGEYGATYGIRAELGTTVYPYLIPAYRFLEEYYGSGTFLNSVENVIDGETGQNVDRDYHLRISGTTSEPVMTFNYRVGSDIYTDTIIFTDINSTTISYNTINYPSKWSDVLDDLTELDLALNAQNTYGRLSFDNDVPFQLFDYYSWSLDASYISYTAVNLYIEVDSLETAKSMLDTYKTTISNNGNYDIDNENSDDYFVSYTGETGLGLDLEAWGSSGYYYLDLYVYGLDGGFGTLITNIAGGSNMASSYETIYSISPTVNTINVTFPYVNPPLGYTGLTYVQQSSGSNWALVYMATYYSSYVQAYINSLYAAVAPKYSSWTESSTTNTTYSITSYSWSKTEDDTTYTLSATWGMSGYYYLIYLRFASETATSE